MSLPKCKKCGEPINCRTCGNEGVYILETTDPFCSGLGKHCQYCKEQLRFAKRHNLRVIYHKASMDIVGVEYDQKRWKGSEPKCPRSKK